MDWRLIAVFAAAALVLVVSEQIEGIWRGVVYGMVISFVYNVGYARGVSDHG